MILTKALMAWIEKHCGVAAGSSDEKYIAALKDAADSGKLTHPQLKELQTLLDDAEKAAGKVSAKDVFGGRIRVRSASERYSSTKSVGRHARTGQTVHAFGKSVETASELEAAQCGAMLKHVAYKAGVSNAALSEHEKELLSELAESEWNTSDGQKSFIGAKAILDDVTSGGLESTPVVFDSNLITFPLLSGELFPLVDLQDVPRGRRIEGASVGNPSVQWGTSEGTEADLFDTSGLIEGIDTNIFNVTCAVEVGLDFLSDSPANVGSVLTSNIGMRLATELDKAIAKGDGVTQPQGLSLAAGTITCNSVSGSGGPLKVSDFESLMFSVPKQYRNAGFRPAFISNDTTYSRARGISVSPTDQRRIFGTDNEQSYTLLGQRYAVNNDLPNNVIMFACLAKYRMYRRMGMTVRFEVGGKELSRKNLGLLIVRARFGGRLIDPNACSKMTDAQA